jgi:hypothetical protein
MLLESRLSDLERACLQQWLKASARLAPSCDPLRAPAEGAVSGAKRPESARGGGDSPPFVNRFPCLPFAAFAASAFETQRPQRPQSPGG